MPYRSGCEITDFGMVAGDVGGIDGTPTVCEGPGPVPVGVVAPGAVAPLARRRSRSSVWSRPSAPTDTSNTIATVNGLAVTAREPQRVTTAA